MGAGTQKRDHQRIRFCFSTSTPPPFAFSISTQAPLAALAAFGAYAAILLVVGILSFRDCPEDAAALAKVEKGKGENASTQNLSTQKWQHQSLLSSPSSPISSRLFNAHTHQQEVATARADLIARGVLDK